MPVTFFFQFCCRALKCEIVFTSRIEDTHRRTNFQHRFSFFFFFIVNFLKTIWLVGYKLSKKNALAPTAMHLKLRSSICICCVFSSLLNQFLQCFRKGDLTLSGERRFVSINFVELINTSSDTICTATLTAWWRAYWTIACCEIKSNSNVTCWSKKEKNGNNKMHCQQ